MRFNLSFGSDSVSGSVVVGDENEYYIREGSYRYVYDNAERGRFTKLTMDLEKRLYDGSYEPFFDDFTGLNTMEIYCDTVTGKITCDRGLIEIY